MDTHYSGVLSQSFWKRVAALSDPGDYGTLYFAGILLQETELRILRQLELAELRQRAAREEKK